MRILCPPSEFKIKAIKLTAAAVIMLFILTINLTVIEAQQQQEEQQLLTSQPASPPLAQNGTLTTTSFESTLDSFQVELPEDWVIQDVNNTDFTLAAEVTEGYGILAQLCPAEESGEEGQQQQGALTNISNSGSGSCQQQQVQQEIIHIIRYPNLGARLGIGVDDIADVVPDSVLNYQIRKLQEVGYRSINITNNTPARMAINYTAALDLPAPAGVVGATVPARLVQLTYSTDSAPNELRTGFLFLTATNAVPPAEMITGYSVFYEGGSGSTAAGAEETTQSANLLPVSPAAVRILNSFELIASAEVAQSIFDLVAQQQAVNNEPNDQVEDAAGEEADDDE